VLDPALLLRREASPVAITLACILAAAAAQWQGSATTVSALVLLTVAAASLWGWYRTQSVWHYIADTPLSKIETAPQGYVELQGACDLQSGRTSQGFDSGPPAIWQRFQVRRTSDNRLIDSGVSSEAFQLTDSTGSCLIYPEGATVLASSRRNWTEKDKRYSVNFIRPGATLYVLGALQTDGGSNTDYNQKVEIANTLSSWKQDQNFLLSEFDTNSDGELDMQEWEAVRQRASTVVQQRYGEICVAPVNHIVRKPADGSPFLISDKDPAPLGRLFRVLAWLNLTLAMASVYLGIAKLTL